MTIFWKAGCLRSGTAHKSDWDPRSHGTWHTSQAGHGYAGKGLAFGPQQVACSLLTVSRALPFTQGCTLRACTLPYPPPQPFRPPRPQCLALRTSARLSHIPIDDSQPSNALPLYPALEPIPDVLRPAPAYTPLQPHSPHNTPVPPPHPIATPQHPTLPRDPLHAPPR